MIKMIAFALILFSITSHAEESSYCSALSQMAKKAKWSLQNPSQADANEIVVDKSRRLMHLLVEGEIIRTYRVALGKNPVGHKQKEGDNKTPEGKYFIEYKNSASDYHLSLKINYPNQDDINKARRNGWNPGGDIMIHGLPNSAFRRAFINHPKDWTRGCVAVTNQEVEEIWSVVQRNTSIELCP